MLPVTDDVLSVTNDGKWHMSMMPMEYSTHIHGRVDHGCKSAFGLSRSQNSSEYLSMSDEQTRFSRTQLSVLKCSCCSALPQVASLCIIWIRLALDWI